MATLAEINASAGPDVIIRTVEITGVKPPDTKACAVEADVCDVRGCTDDNNFATN